MGARGAEFSPVSPLELERSQALSAIGSLNDSKISQEWAQEGYEIGQLQLNDLLNPPTLAKRYSEFKVAIHERGHEAVARAYSWMIHKVSVVPDGNTLGVTVTSPGFSRSFKTLLAERIAIASGGEAAEEMDGNDDHRGAGSDRGNARFFAKILSMISGDSQGSILSHGMSAARMAVGSLGRNTLRARAWRLTQEKVA